MTTSHAVEMTAGSVASRDGTRIGYLRTGAGPAVVLLHGSMESARSHTLLAKELADSFTVYLPDRRGRGTSGSYGSGYGIRTEVEDLEAVMAASGAQMAFGVSASGLVLLEAARVLPGIDRIAVYEPALVMSPGGKHTTWMARYDEEMAQDKVSAAMVTSMLGLDLAPPPMRVMPRKLLAMLTDLALKSDDKKAGPEHVTMRQLAFTLGNEGRLLAEMAGRIDSFRGVDAQVLLLGGGKGLEFLKPSRAALARTLPSCRLVEFPELDHGSSSDPGQTNPRGGAERVATVARKVRPFFAGTMGTASASS